MEPNSDGFSGGESNDSPHYNRLCFNMTTMSQIDEEEDPPSSSPSSISRGGIAAVAEGDASSLNLNLSAKTTSGSMPGSANSTPRSLACPPKKAKPAVPRKPLVVLDPNLEQTAMWDDSTMSIQLSPVVRASVQPSGGTPKSALTPVPPTLDKPLEKAATPRCNLPINTPKSELRGVKNNAGAASRLATPAIERSEALVLQSHWEEQKSFLRHEIEIFATVESACQCEKFAAIMQEYRELEERENACTTGATRNDIVARSTQTPARAGNAHESSGLDKEMELEMLLTEKAMLKEAKLKADIRSNELTSELADEKHRCEETEKRVADLEAQLANFQLAESEKAMLTVVADEAKAHSVQVEEKFESEAKSLRESCAVAESRALELAVELRIKSEQMQREFEAQMIALEQEKVDLEQKLLETGESLASELEARVGLEQKLLETGESLASELEARVGLEQKLRETGESLASELQARVGLEQKLRETGESLASELQARVALEEKLGQLISENTSLCAKKEGLQLELDQCSAKFDAEKCSLVEQIEQRVNATMAQKDECFQNEIERLEAGHAAKIEEQTRLQAELGEKFDELLSEKDTLSASRERLEAEMDSIRAQLHGEREKRGKLEMKLGEIGLEKDCLLTEKNKALEELSNTTAKLEQQSEQLAAAVAVEKELVELKLACASECAVKDTAREEAKALATKMASANAVISELEGAKTTLVGEMSTLQRSLEKADERMKELSAKIGQQRTEWIETEERLLQEQTQLKEVNDEMKGKLAKLEAELVEEKASRRETEPILAEKDAVLNANVELEAQLSTLKSQMEKEWDEFDRLENEFRSENFELRKEILKLKRQLNLITDEEACAQLGFDIQQPCVNV